MTIPEMLEAAGMVADVLEWAERSLPHAPCEHSGRPTFAHDGTTCRTDYDDPGAWCVPCRFRDGEREDAYAPDVFCLICGFPVDGVGDTCATCGDDELA